MTNEKAANLLERVGNNLWYQEIEGEYARYTKDHDQDDAIQLAIAALRSPAPGAVAMREALTKIARAVATEVIQEEVSLRLSGLTLADLGIGVLVERLVNEHIAALPAPEVPDGN